MTTIYDILILGSGPIGASTAYHLGKQGRQNIGLITQDPTEAPEATYRWAGGSVRTFWDDPVKVAMTQTTTDFIRSAHDSGVDLGLHEDHYLFLNRLKSVPAINVSGLKLVNYLLTEAEASGVKVRRQEVIKSVQRETNDIVVTTTKGTFRARKVLLALGYENKNYMPDYELELEYRELFVLDNTVGPEEMDMPHTVIPVGEGVVYFFVKLMPEGPRLLLGQEDVVETSDHAGNNAKFDELLKAGLVDSLPVFSKSKVIRTLWGRDAGNKTLKFEERDGIYAANCGSAARGCIWIGQEIVSKME